MSKLKDMDAGRLADSFVAVSHGALSALGAGYLVFMLLAPRVASVLYHQFLLVAAASHLAKVRDPPPETAPLAPPRMALQLLHRISFSYNLRSETVFSRALSHPGEHRRFGQSRNRRLLMWT